MQPSLFDQPPTPDRLVWQPGSDTSKAAAQRAERFADSQRARVYAWLVMQGTHGGTQEEVSIAVGIKRQSLCPRFRELERAGQIEKGAESRGGGHVYRVRT